VRTAADTGEPDPAATTVPNWGKRLVCGRYGSRNVSFVVSGTRHDSLGP